MNSESENSYLSDSILNVYESQRDLPLLIAVLDQIAKSHKIFTSDFDIASSQIFRLSKSDIDLILKCLIIPV